MDINKFADASIIGLVIITIGAYVSNIRGARRAAEERRRQIEIAQAEHLRVIEARRLKNEFYRTSIDVNNQTLRNRGNNV